jgi:transposase InsO family protein
VAIIDWASRAVLAWRLSNTMDTRFCVIHGILSADSRRS